MLLMVVQSDPRGMIVYSQGFASNFPIDHYFNHFGNKADKATCWL